MPNIENPMVIDSLWGEREQEPQIFGECAGCEMDIVAGEDYYEIRNINSNEILKVHQEHECCRQFVAEMAWCRTAGE